MKYWISKSFDPLVKGSFCEDPKYSYFFSVYDHFMFDCPKHLQFPFQSRQLARLLEKSPILDTAILGYYCSWPDQPLVDSLLGGFKKSSFDETRFLCEFNSYLKDNPSPSLVINGPTPDNFEKSIFSFSSSFNLPSFLLKNFLRAGLLSTMPIGFHPEHSDFGGHTAPLGSFSKEITSLCEKVHNFAPLSPLVQFLLYTDLFWSSLFSSNSTNSFSNFYHVSGFFYYKLNQRTTLSDSSLSLQEDFLDFPRKVQSSPISIQGALKNLEPNNSKDVSMFNHNVMNIYGIAPIDVDRMMQSFLSLSVPKTGGFEDGEED